MEKTETKNNNNNSPLKAVTTRPRLQEKDWWHPGHLSYLAKKYERLSTEQDEALILDLQAKMRALGANIVRSKRFSLLWLYYQNYIVQAVNLPIFNTLHTILYREVCVARGKLLLGVRGEKNGWLWADIPPEVGSSRDLNLWYDLAAQATTLMPLLTGAGIQGNFDRLLVPAADRFSVQGKWPAGAVDRFEIRLAELLGFEEGFVGEDEVEQIIAQALLDRRYTLVDDRPVLVRLEENPLIDQLVLVQKGDKLLARIETFRYGDLIGTFSINEVSYGTNLDFIKAQEIKRRYEQRGIRYEAFTIHEEIIKSRNFSVLALIATIYRDLVTADKVDGGVRFSVSGSSKKRRKEEPEVEVEGEDNKPKMMTTAWQIIPRRLYTRFDSDITVERNALTKEEEARQKAFRRYHAVMGHVRRYRNREEGWTASAERQDLAVADGIILKPGETYVKPHARGLSALEALGDIRLEDVPHYLRRKRG